MIVYNLKKSTKRCGGKAYGLSRLLKCNTPVPSGFVISSIKNSIDYDILKKHLKIFNIDDELAIRSSANIEDGVLQSFAGMFDSVLNVSNDIKAVSHAIDKVLKSANNHRVEDYSKEKDIEMNIIVQKMIKARVSGICFTKVIDIDGCDAMLIEYVEGCGEQLVSGKSNSNRVIIKYIDDNLDLNSCRIEGNLINFTGFEKLIKIIVQITSNIKEDLDIEWCIDNDNNPFIVQARPITKRVFINKENNNNSNNAIIASKGCVEGETYVIDSDLEYDKVKKMIDNFPSGKILVTNFTETYYLPAMKKAIGIITNTGSSLCHAAIVARELNIPCIVGYDNATMLFPSNTHIKLDATNNMIVSDKVNNKISRHYRLDYGNLDCFDNYISLIINNIKLFIEFTFDGIMIHMPNNTNSCIIDEIEYFIRKKFSTAPTYCSDENKYLWIKEIERFKRLPRFNDYLERIKKISKSFDCDSLISIQKELIDYAREIINYKKKCNDVIINSFIDETIASINELLDGIIPFGYPLYESYTQSLQLLEKEKIFFNDLFDSNTSIKNNKLKSIQKFLNVVSNIKNNSYQIIWDLGGTDPDYFEKRDNNIRNILIQNGVTINDEIMNVFYNKYVNYYIKNMVSVNEKS